MKQHLLIQLPFPPSVNNYYKRNRYGGQRISDRGLDFRIAVHTAVHNNGWNLGIAQRMHVAMLFHAPDNRVRDLDNYKKALWDACTKAGVWLDDKLIDGQSSDRGDNVLNGSVELLIRWPHNTHKDSIWDTIMRQHLQ